jgi:hypothetical protein
MHINEHCGLLEHVSVACSVPNICSEAGNRLVIAGINRSHMHSQQMAERIHGHVNLRPALALGAVRAAAGAALGRRAECAAVDDRSRWLFLATRRQAQHRPQI